MNIKKLITLSTLSCFLYSFVFAPALQAAADLRAGARTSQELLDSAILPPTVGRITEAKNFGSKKVVINIQDLHCHAEVERNIGSILGHFDRRYGLQRVYVEGAIAGVDTSWLADIRDTRLKERLLGSMIDEGKLTGAEYYSVVAGKPRLLYGMEDKDVYIPNLVRLGEILEKRDTARATLADLRKTVDRLKKTYYSPRTRKLDALIAGNKGGAIGSEKYYQLLTKYGQNCGLDMRRYTNLTALLGLAETNKNLNYPSISRELPDLLLALRQNLPYGVYQGLRTETGDFARADELLVRLPKIARQYHVDIAGRFPNTGKLLHYVRASQGTNPLKLMSEEKRLIAELHAKLAADVPEREVLFLSDLFGYLESYADAEIPADDYRYFSDNLPEFRFLWAKYTLSDKLASLDTYFAVLDEYYRVNIERNNLFLKNLSDVLPSGKARTDAPAVQKAAEADDILAGVSGDDIIITVTGGFHTAGLAELLSEKNISYIVVTPQITAGTAESDAAYASIIRQQARMLGSSLQQLDLSQSPSFLRMQVVIGVLLNQNIRAAGVNIADVEKQAKEALGQPDAFSVEKHGNGGYRVRVGQGDAATDLFYVLQNGKIVADGETTPELAGPATLGRAHAALFDEVASALAGLVHLDDAVRVEGKSIGGTGILPLIRKTLLCVTLGLFMTLAPGISLAGQTTAVAAGPGTHNALYDTVAVERLIGALNGDDWSARTRAERTLIALGTQAAEALTGALGNESRYIRSGAAIILGKTGAASAREPVTALLNDKDIYVRSSAAKALGYLRSPAAVPALIASLSDERNAAIRETAIVPALVRIGKPVEQQLIAASRSENPAVQRGISLALQEITPVTEGTGNGAAAVAGSETVQAAAQPNDTAAAPGTDKRSVARRVLQVLYFVSLGYMLVSTVRAMLVMRAIRSVDRSLNVNFAAAFNAMSDGRGRAFYLSQLYESKNTGTRHIAIEEAARSGSRGLGLLFDALSDEDPALRSLAASFLVNMDRKLYPELMRLINGKGYWSERSLGETIGVLGDMKESIPDCQAFLGKNVENDYASVRQTALAALQKRGMLTPDLLNKKYFVDVAYEFKTTDKAIIEELRKAGSPALIADAAVSGSNSPVVKIGALKVLQSVGALREDHIPLLISLLRESYLVKTEAVMLLRDMLANTAVSGQLYDAISRENPPLWTLFMIKKNNVSLIDDRSFNKLFKSIEGTLAGYPENDRYYLMREMANGIDAYLQKYNATPFDTDAEDVAGLIDIVHDNTVVCLRCLENAGLRIRDIEELKKMLPLNGPLTRILRAMGEKTAGGGYADVTAAVSAAGKFEPLYRLVIDIAARKQRSAPAQVIGIFEVLREYNQQGDLKKWSAKDWVSFNRDVQEYFDAGFSIITLKLFDLFVKHKSDAGYIGNLKTDIDAAVRDIGWGAFFGLAGDLRSRYGFSDTEEMVFISRYGEINKLSIDDYRAYYDDVKEALSQKGPRQWQAEIPVALRALYTLKGINKHVIYQPGESESRDMDAFLARLASYASGSKEPLSPASLLDGENPETTKAALINLVVPGDGRETGHTDEYFATVPETPGEQREWLSRWYTLIADTLKVDYQRVVQDSIETALRHRDRSIEAQESILESFGFKWIDLANEGKWPQSDGQLGKLVAQNDESGLVRYFRNKWLPSMKYKQLADGNLFARWTENSFIAAKPQGYFAVQDIPLVKRALYAARDMYLRDKATVASLRTKQLGGKLRDNALKLFDGDIAEIKYHLDNFREIGGSSEEDFYVGLFDDLLHLSGEFMLSGVCTNYDRGRQIREGDSEGYHFATIALKDAAGRVYGYAQVQVLKVPVEGYADNHSGGFRVLALTGINISEKELPMERSRAVLAILEGARSLAARCGFQAAVIPSNTSIHSNQGAVRSVISELARKGHLKTADLASTVTLSKKIPGRSLTYNYNYKTVYVIGTLPDIQVTAVVQDEPAGHDTISPLASQKRANISLLNRIGMAGFTTTVGGIVGTLLFASPIGWLIGAVISGHYFRQAYYIAKAGLERGPATANGLAKLLYVVANLSTDAFVAAKASNGGIGYNDNIMWRIPPFMREEINAHEQYHLTFQHKHPVLSRIPLLEEIIVSLNEFKPKTSLSGVVSAFRSFRLPRLRMLKYALLLPVLMAGGGYAPAAQPDRTTVWSEHARELAAETETILTELRVCIEPGDKPRFNDSIFVFLDIHSEIVAKHSDYPVEAAWPVLKAIVQLDKPLEQELVRLIKEHYRGHERSALIDAILLMNNEVVGNWLYEQGNELIGRKVYYMSAETTHWAGGLGPVMTFHGKGMKELGADVEYIEPCYQLRRDKGNPEGDPLFYGDLGVTDITDVYEYDVEVSGSKVRVKVMHGVNKDGVGTYLVRDVQDDGSSYYTRMLYNYGKSYNPASWEDFTSFFCVASAELIRRLETERKEKLGDAWKPAIVHTNDGQTAPLAAIAKGKYENDPVMAKIVYAFTTHTYKNRGVAGRAQGTHVLETMMGITKQYLPAFMRYDIADYTSGGIRLSNWSGAVSRQHRDDVAYIDPTAHSIGVTNGAVPEMMASLFREKLTEKYPGADVERPTVEQVQDTKLRCKQLLNDMRVRTANGGEVAVDPGRILISYCRRLVREKAGRDRALTDDNITELVRRGASVVLFGNHQGTNESEWLASGLRELENRIARMKAESPDRFPGTFQFVQAFTAEQKMAILAATDIQVQDSDRTTGAAEFSEEDITANGGLEFSPPYSEGVIMAQGLPLAFERPGSGNTVVPENASPASYLEAFMKAIRLYDEDKTGFYRNCAASVRINRIQRYLLTSAAYLREYNRILSRIETEKAEDRRLVGSIAAEAGNNVELAAQLLFSGRNGVNEFCFYDRSQGDAPVYAPGRGITSFLAKKDELEKTQGYEATLHHLEAGDYQHYVESLFGGLGCSSEIAAWFERLNSSPATVLEKDARITGMLKMVAEKLRGAADGVVNAESLKLKATSPYYSSVSERNGVPVSVKSAGDLQALAQQIGRDKGTREITAWVQHHVFRLVIENGIALTDDEIWAILDSIDEREHPVVNVPSTILIGLLDRSPYLFEDHLSNGFIGINKVLFEKIGAEDPSVRDILLQTGLRHELIHECTGKNGLAHELRQVGADSAWAFGLMQTRLAPEKFTEFIDTMRSHFALSEFIDDLYRFTNPLAQLLSQATGVPANLMADSLVRSGILSRELKFHHIPVRKFLDILARSGVEDKMHPQRIVCGRGERGEIEKVILFFRHGPTGQLRYLMLARNERSPRWAVAAVTFPFGYTPADGQVTDLGSLMSEISENDYIAAPDADAAPLHPAIQRVEGNTISVANANLWAKKSENTSGAWSSRPWYVRYVAWWFETLVSFGVGAVVLAALSHIPGLQTYVFAPAVAAAAAALTFWLPHFKYRGIDYAQYKNIVVFSVVTYASALWAFTMGVTPSTFVVAGAYTAAHWGMNTWSGTELKVVPLKIFRKDVRRNLWRNLATSAPRNMMTGLMARQAAEPAEVRVFKNAYPSLAGKTVVTMCVDLTIADVNNARALARTGAANAVMVSRATPMIPVQQDDMSVVMMPFDTACTYAAERGAAVELFNVPVRTGSVTEPVVMRAVAFKYASEGGSASAIYLDPIAGSESYPSLAGRRVNLDEKDTSILRRAFMDTLVRISEDRSEQPKLFTLGLPVKKIEPAVIEMKGMAALFAPHSADDEYHDLFTGSLLSYIPDPALPAGMDPDHLGLLFDVRIADDKPATPDTWPTGKTAKNIPAEPAAACTVQAKLAVYEPAIIIKNAESVSGVRSTLISKVTNIRKLLPSPYDQTSAIGKISYLPARVRDLKDGGVNGMLIAPFDNDCPYAVDINIIDESDAVKAFPELAAFRPRAAADSGYVDAEALTPQVRAFWQRCFQTASNNADLMERLERFSGENPRCAAYARGTRLAGISPEAFLLAQMYGHEQLSAFLSFAAGGDIGAKVYGGFSFDGGGDPALIREAAGAWMGRKTDGRPATAGVFLDLAGLRDIPSWLPDVAREARQRNPDAEVFVIGSRQFDREHLKEICDAAGINIVDRRLADGESVSPYSVAGDNVSVEIVPQGGLLSARSGPELRRLLENLRKKCARASSVILPDDLLADAVASDDPARRYLLPSEKTADTSAMREILAVLGINRVTTPEERGMDTALNLDDKYIPSLGYLPYADFQKLLHLNEAARPDYIDTAVMTLSRIPWLSKEQWQTGWQKIEKLQRRALVAAPGDRTQYGRELYGFIYGTWQRVLIKRFAPAERAFINSCDARAFDDLLVRAGNGAEEKGRRLADVDTLSGLVSALVATETAEKGVGAPADLAGLKAQLLRDPDLMVRRPEMLALYADLLAGSDEVAPDNRELLNRCIEVLKRDSDIGSLPPAAIAGMIRLFVVAADRKENVPSLDELRAALRSANTAAIKALNGAG